MVQVTEVHPEQSTVAGTAEHAVVPGATEAEAEASAAEAKAAAYKLRRAKAHAHLLTRGAKALVYSKLQVTGALCAIWDFSGVWWVYEVCHCYLRNIGCCGL